jgi:hypothetical protein
MMRFGEPSMRQATLQTKASRYQLQTKHCPVIFDESRFVPPLHLFDSLFSISLLSQHRAASFHQHHLLASHRHLHLHDEDTHGLATFAALPLRLIITCHLLDRLRSTVDGGEEKVRLLPTGQGACHLVDRRKQAPGRVQHYLDSQYLQTVEAE